MKKKYFAALAFCAGISLLGGCKSGEYKDNITIKKVEEISQEIQERRDLRKEVYDIVSDLPRNLYSTEKKGRKITLESTHEYSRLSRTTYQSLEIKITEKDSTIILKDVTYNLHSFENIDQIVVNGRTINPIENHYEVMFDKILRLTKEGLIQKNEERIQQEKTEKQERKKLLEGMLNFE